MMKPVDFSSDITQPKLMPGQMLKTAREAQNIPIEAVSKHLHLTLPTIHSIEEDQYQHMPAPVYVRGYLRRYAQFLKISPEEVLKAFEQNVEIKSKILEEVPSYVKKKPITSSHVGIRFLTYSIAVLLLILVGIWWKGYEKIEKNPVILHEIRMKSTPSPSKIEPAETSKPKEAVTTESQEETSQAVTSEKNDSINKELKMKESKIPQDQNSATDNIKQRINGRESGIKEKRTYPARQRPKPLDLY